jgi:2-keto-3-deoxygluconate permease
MKSLHDSGFKLVKYDKRRGLNMPIKRAIDKIPGGMMIIPLLIGAILRTVFPHLADNTVFKSSFTGGLLTSASTLLAAFYICLGSTIEFKATGYILKKGIALWLGKVALAAVIGLVIKAVVPDQNHMFLGLSALAIVAAFSDTNGGLYMALMGQFGKRAEDIAAYSIMSLESGPFFTMLILGVAGLASFPLMSFVYAILPLIIGMVLGNLDIEMRKFLSQGQNVLIPLFALALGFGINLKNVISAGVSGLILGLAVVVITGLVLVALDRVTGGTGLAGIAAASTAGNAAAVPVAVAAVYAEYKGIAATATVQVAAAVIVTSILVPILTAWFSKRDDGKATAEATMQT